jgi:hypothetical protein
MQFAGSLPGDGTPGIKLIKTLWAKYNRIPKFNTAYWEGVTVGSIMVRAFQKAHEMFGKINSQTINDALQEFRNEDFGGLVPNVTYTKTDHGASWTARILRINEDQTFTPLTKFWAPGKEKVTILK